MSLGTSAKRNLVIVIAIAMALLAAAAPVLGAAADLSLPSTPVNMIVNNDTESYFVTALSGVPSGNYTVQNATYAGWCIDRTANMTRGQIFNVRLYSSLDPPAGNLSSVQWNMVNYVLNHKQGTANDTQQAIWHFASMTGNYTPTSSIAMAIVNDALANGTNFIPDVNQTIAVICFPQVIFPEGPEVQDSIIEVKVPAAPQIPEFPIAAIPLIFIMGALTAGIVYAKKRNPHETKQTKPTLKPQKNRLRHGT